MIAKVDCTVETALCSENDVTGYPTLKFFKKGEEADKAEKYRGARDMDALVKFINKKLGKEVEEVRKTKIDNTTSYANYQQCAHSCTNG